MAESKASIYGALFSGSQIVDGINRLEKEIRQKFQQIKQIYFEAQNMSKKEKTLKT